MKTGTKSVKEAPKTLDLLDRLKSIVESELNRLPDLLDGLNDKDRLDVILKLMPLIMPKAKPTPYYNLERTDW